MLLHIGLLSLFTFSLVEPSARRMHDLSSGSNLTQKHGASQIRNPKVIGGVSLLQGLEFQGLLKLSYFRNANPGL